MEMFRLKLVVDGQACEVGYSDFVDFMQDKGLRALFEDGLVSECTIYTGSLRIAGIPFMDWKRLRDSLISNSPRILQERNKS